MAVGPSMKLRYVGYLAHSVLVYFPSTEVFLLFTSPGLLMPNTIMVNFVLNQQNYISAYKQLTKAEGGVETKVMERAVQWMIL